MDENQNILKALEITTTIYETIRNRLRKGTSEKEIYSWVDKIMAPYRKKNRGDFLGDFISGPRTSEIGGDPTGRRMEETDIFMIDLSLKFEDQWCDTCRTFFLGEPTEKQREAYETVLNCMKVGEETVKAGVEASSIKAKMEEYLVSRGYGGLMPHHAGHAVGKECYLKPAFEEQCNMTVADGEIVTLEPGVYFTGEWGVRVENNYIVRGDRLEKIFDYPTDIEYFIIRRNKNEKQVKSEE